MRKTSKRKRVGGLKRKKKWAHNIVEAHRTMRGGGPTFNAPGHTRRSLRTHARVASGNTGTFAV
jgi:hypothetical protein